MEIDEGISLGTIGAMAFDEFRGFSTECAAMEEEEVEEEEEEEESADTAVEFLAVILVVVVCRSSNL